MASSKTKKIVRIAAEQLNLCYYCAREFAPETWHLVTLDHKTPKARGGSNGRSNLVASCLKCNMMKAVLTEAEFWQCFEEAHARTVALLARKWPIAEYTSRDQIYRIRFVAKLGGLAKSRSLKIIRAINAAAGVREATPIVWPPKIAGRGAVVARLSGGQEVAGSMPAVPTI